MIGKYLENVPPYTVSHYRTDAREIEHIKIYWFGSQSVLCHELVAQPNSSWRVNMAVYVVMLMECCVGVDTPIYTVFTLLRK